MDIEILCEKTSNAVNISISDNGTGISKEGVTKLFNYKYAQKTTGTNGEKGTGLGLILSKDFIQINNHTIVNMRYITEISHNEIWLDSVDKSFEISRGKFKETLKTYQKYLITGNTL